jgi:pimeloyl-ACP methyl ester carboxylesterase
MLLVPALGCDGRLFAPLAPLAAGRRDVFWNLPNALPRTPGLDALTDLVMEHADLCGMPARFVIGGSSIGAILALAAAVRAPGRMAGIVLFSGAAAWSELGRAIRFTRWLHPLFPRRTYHEWIARVLIPGSVVPAGADPLADALRAQMRHRTKDYLAGIIAAVRGGGGFDLRPLLADVRAPTLVVHSTRDRVIPYRAARTLAAIPDARVVALDSSSHVPFLTDPETSLAALREFLARVDEKEAA